MKVTKLSEQNERDNQDLLGRLARRIDLLDDSPRAQPFCVVVVVAKNEGE